MSEDRNESRQAEIMSKQDLQGVRTPADVERKYNFGKKFSEVYEIADGARETAEAAKKIAEEAGGNLTKEEIFNILTDNGTWQGIYRDNNGNMYINGTYIKAGTFTATGKVRIYPHMGVVRNIEDYLSGGTAIAYDKLSLYDFDGDGEVTAYDKEIARQVATGEQGFCDGILESDVTVTINPSDPESFILVSGTDQWGFSFYRSIGLDSAFMQREKDGSIYWYDEITGEKRYINPPMYLGHEYKSAFQWYGSPITVYKDPLSENIACRLWGGETYTESLHLNVSDIYQDGNSYDYDTGYYYSNTFYLSRKIESIVSVEWTEDGDYFYDTYHRVTDDGGVQFYGYPFDDYNGDGNDVIITYRAKEEVRYLFGDEEGEIDGWTYRKSPSGICECWKTFTNVPFETKVSWGNGYLSSQNGGTYQHWFSLPSGLLTSGDVAHIDLGTPGYVMMACFTNVSAAGVTCYIWSPTSYDGSTPIGKVCISVKGRWK